MPQISQHAQSRMQQRGIRSEHIDLAMQYGDPELHHGDYRFTLNDRALRDTPHRHLADRPRGLCVVVTPDNVIKTVKWHYTQRQRAGVLKRSRLAS